MSWINVEVIRGQNEHVEPDRRSRSLQRCMVQSRVSRFTRSFLASVRWLVESSRALKTVWISRWVRVCQPQRCGSRLRAERRSSFASTSGARENPAQIGCSSVLQEFWYLLVRRHVLDEFCKRHDRIYHSFKDSTRDAGPVQGVPVRPQQSPTTEEHAVEQIQHWR